MIVFVLSCNFLTCKHQNIMHIFMYFSPFSDHLNDAHWKRSIGNIAQVNRFSLSPQIDYFNNKIICHLVEQQHTGIIALLDEACFLVGTVTDRVRGCGRVMGHGGVGGMAGARD